MDTNTKILIYMTGLLLISELTLIYKKIDIPIYFFAIIGQAILVYSIYNKNSKLCSMSHNMFILTLVAILIFSKNIYSLLLLLILLILTTYFREKQKICPFRKYDKEKSYITDNFDINNNLILILIILTIIKLCYITNK